MTVVEILERARALIATPERWTKGAAARDAFGNEVYPRTVAAVCFCGYGATWATGVILPAAEMALDAAVGMDYPDWNDAPERTHAEVLAAFAKAIGSERAKAVRT